MVPYGPEGVIKLEDFVPESLSETSRLLDCLVGLPEALLGLLVEFLAVLNHTTGLGES